MLAKETVSARLNSDEGLSFTEFSYQILQGMDYLELYRRYDCTLQTGGSDQWGNLTSGTELIRKVEGRAVHAVATPLITKADGTKFGKSEGGAVWLDPEMTSPYAFYQFWFNTDDRDIGGYLKVFSMRPLDEIADLATSTAERPQAREGQRALAGELTALVHGEAARDGVVQASGALFGRGELAGIDEGILHAALSEAGLTRTPHWSDSGAVAQGVGFGVIALGSPSGGGRGWREYQQRADQRPGPRPVGLRPAARQIPGVAERKAGRRRGADQELTPANRLAGFCAPASRERPEEAGTGRLAAATDRSPSSPESGSVGDRKTRTDVADTSANPVRRRALMARFREMYVAKPRQFGAGGSWLPADAVRAAVRGRSCDS